MTQWSIGLLKKKMIIDNHSIESHFSHATVLFFLHKYQLQWRKNKSFKEENNQSTKEVWLRCMSDHEWHDITRYNLIMPQKSMIKKLYNIKSISHH